MNVRIMAAATGFIVAGGISAAIIAGCASGATHESFVTPSHTATVAPVQQVQPATPAAPVYTPETRTQENNDAFYALLQGEGVFASDVTESAAVSFGHAVCDALTSGNSFAAVTIDLVNHTGLSYAKVGDIIGAANAAFCPSYTLPSN